MNAVIEAIRAVRTAAAEMNGPRRRRQVLISTLDDTEAFGEQNAAFFTKLAYASEVVFRPAEASREDVGADAVTIVIGAATLYIPLAEMVDFEAEVAPCQRKRKCRKEIKRAENCLQTKALYQAPAAVIEAERAKLEKWRDTLSGIEAALCKAGQIAPVAVPLRLGAYIRAVN